MSRPNQLILDPALEHTSIDEPTPIGVGLENELAIQIQGFDFSRVHSYYRIYAEAERSQGATSRLNIVTPGMMEAIRHYVPDDMERIGDFLSNGMRLYADHGHPEASTPECTSIIDLLHAHMAGKLVVREMFERATQAGLMSKAILNTMLVNPPTPLGDADTWGSHENYMAPVRMSPKLYNVHMPLATHYAARQPFTSSYDPYRGLLSQRARHFMSLAASNTTENRPVVNTRHEPHGTHYRRIHVISADANELPGANALKIGMGNMVNRLIAHGAQLDHLYLRDPVRAFREFGEDMTFTHTAETLDGKRLTALDIEEQFVDLVAQLEEQTGILTDEEWKILWWQQELIDALRKSGDHSALVGVADWATKYDLMMDRTKDEALKVAIGWGSLGKGSLSTWKIESGQFELPLDFSMDEVRRYVHEAPAGRAQRRGALITKLAGLGHTLETAEVDFSWARIRTPNVWRARPIDLGTPFGDTPTEEQIDMWVQERVPDLRDKEAYRQFIGIRDEGIIDYD